MTWLIRLFGLTIVVVAASLTLRGEPVPSAAVTNTERAIARLKAAGMQVTPVALPRLVPEPWTYEPDAGGAHLRLRLKGVSRPGLRNASPAAHHVAGITADLYLSTWKVVPQQGAVMLLVDIRVLDPLRDDETIWSQAFLTPADELQPLQRALQQAISEALQRSLDQQHEFVTV